MKDNIYELLVMAGNKQQLETVLSCNARTEKYGLSLTKEEAQMLVQSRQESLKTQRRVEFGEGIITELIDAFCDSVYIDQNNYVQTLTQLQDIFYLYKNEAQDNLTDDELIMVMKELYEGICFGSVEYLEETCLERFARAVRAGYRGYEKSGGKGEASKFSEEKRWDRDLYLEVLYDELC
ncbi:DUF6323 family protein [Kineothrix sp. MB12-C1]|uniref:DUF6323 family protein n=1 Tax=Kineothrix sp. MB12-C1 TaxID=3070215 RepID=UPI0027D2F4E1|nr:DUF6323 family protein [Kineothrix sp. MB12-C1]WMC93038.1 DUF6323 family protein [Kineothrix sp. MB12-C1]